MTGGKKDKDSGSMMDTFMLIPETGMVIHAPPMLYGHSSHVALLVKD